MNNKIIVAAAGSGKTTYLVNQALQITNESVLITTYTRTNEVEIKRKLYEKNGCIPSNITVMTWFTFLLKHGVRPYQDTLEYSLWNKNIGFFLTNRKSGIKFKNKSHSFYWGEKDFYKHYFYNNTKIYSDKISKFILQANSKSNNKVIKRIGDIFSNIFIDEVQDLAGYDYELLRLLFYIPTKIILVGDPRQVTYLTHPTDKYEKYQNGKLIKFIEEVINKKKTICSIDTDTLNVSHRNNQEICDYSSLLYPELPPPKACKCYKTELIDHQGIYLVHPNYCEQYICKYKPEQIRYSKNQIVSKLSNPINMGESKGLTFDRVIIYPTDTMKKWIQDNNAELKSESRAKFYVALTRAKYSVAIVHEFSESLEFGTYSRLKRYEPENLHS